MSKKITGLDAVTTLAADDLLVLVDYDATTTKNVTVEDFLGNKTADIRRNWYYYPEDYGAVGDGIADDTTALIDCANAAYYRAIVLKPYATYLYSGLITISNHTIILGNHAILKRRAGTTLVSTTLTDIAENAPAGSTVQVADPSKFQVNMDVSLDDGAPSVTGPTFTLANHKITDITGDVLTLATAFTTAMPTGSYIRMSTAGLWLQPECKVYNLRCDGNRANQLIGADQWGYWGHHSEIICRSSTIEHCEIYNAQSEGITVNSSTHSVINDNYFHDCNGNGLHFSGATEDIVSVNQFYNNNLLNNDASALLTENTQHNEAHICTSLSNYHISIVDNKFLDTGAYGIAYLGTSCEYFNILGNTFLNCVSGPSLINTGAKRIKFDNNEIADCGPLTVYGTSLVDGPAWVSVQNNHFDASIVNFDYVNHGIFMGNTMNCPLVASPFTASDCEVDLINEHNLIVDSGV